MHKILAGLICFAVLAAAVIGAGLAGRSLFQAPEIRAELAHQESAKAAVMAAQAESARAAAAMRASDAAAWQATEADRAAAIRAAAYGLAGALVILALGGAMAGAHWLELQARTIRPTAAGWPILTERQSDGALAVIDTARLIGPVAIVCQDGQVLAPAVGAEETMARIATQAQAAAVLVGVAASAKGGGQADAVIERVTAVAERLPAPQFAAAPVGAADQDDGLRLVYVHQAQSQSAMELAELGEMIRQAEIRGLARSTWIGDGAGRRPFMFATRRECNRARYETMIDRLRKAGVVEPAGRSWRLSVGVDEALAAFRIDSESETHYAQ